MTKKAKLFISLASFSCSTIPTTAMILKDELKMLNATTTIQGPNYNWVILVAIVAAAVILIVTIITVVVLQKKKNKRYQEEVDSVYEALAHPEPFYVAGDLSSPTLTSSKAHRLQAPKQPVPQLNPPTVNKQMQQQKSVSLQKTSTRSSNAVVPPKIEVNAPPKSLAPMKKR